MAYHLGAPRLATVLFWRAWRAEKESAAGCAGYVEFLSETRGPLAVWEYLNGIPPPVVRGGNDLHTYLLARRAQLAALFRDFEKAELWLEQVRGWEHPWIPVAEAYVLEQADRYEEADSAFARALEVDPLNAFVPGNRGATLVAAGRPAEGLAWCRKVPVANRTADSRMYFRPPA